MDKRIKALVADLNALNPIACVPLDDIINAIDSEGACWIETLELFVELAERHDALTAHLDTFRQMVIDEMATDIWELKSLLESDLFWDWSELDIPTFGGDEPRDTYAIQSWDDEQVLVGTCAEDLALEPR